MSIASFLSSFFRQRAEAQEQARYFNDPYAEPPASLKRDFSDLLVPIIFADGETDDLPGLAAAITDQPVRYNGKIYQPGETISIRARVLLLDCEAWVWDIEGVELLPAFSGFGHHHISRSYMKQLLADGHRLRVTRPTPGRVLEVSNTAMTFR